MSLTTVKTCVDFDGKQQLWDDDIHVTRFLCSDILLSTERLVCMNYKYCNISHALHMAKKKVPICLPFQVIHPFL